MKEDKITETWRLYESGIEYNSKLSPSIYEVSEKNERFYAGDQWRGVQANGLPTPVFNVFKRVLDYFVASVLGSKIKIRYNAENIPTNTDDPAQQAIQKAVEDLSGYAETKWEKLKMDSMLRDGLLDAALSGDVAAITLWDPEIDTGQTSGKGIQFDESGNPIEQPVPIMGDFYTELVDSVNVIFGNPNDRRVEKQPYILVAGRSLVSELQEEAKANKVSEAEIDKIVPDLDYDYQSGDRGKIELEGASDINGKCTYVIKFWKDKKNKTVYWSKSTRGANIVKPVDMKISRYPIAFANWNKRKNSYHGQAPGTGLIPNQIVINKIHAMISKWTFDMAFGKVVYNHNLIREWTNAIGVSIPVDGDTTGAVTQVQPGQINRIVVDLFNMTMQKTLEMLGANDVVLGTVRPENTSAIIAIQKQSAVPLENVKMNLYQLVEDIALIWLEFMLKKYDIPRSLSISQDNQTQIKPFDANVLKDALLSVKVDVGPSTYWSEIASVQTLDNLLMQNKLSMIQYLERMPDGVIGKRQELIEEFKVQDMAQQNTEILYKLMADYVLTLPPDVQAQLESLRELNPQQYEMQIKQMIMSGGGGGGMSGVR